MKRLAQQLEGIYLRLDRQLGGRLTILIRTGLAFDQDDGAIVSRSIAYYALFSLFPLLLVLMSFSSSVLAVEEAQQVVLELVNRYLPVATDLIQANIEQVLSARSTIGILALLGLIWSASGVFTAIYRAVNRAWGNPKSQLFWSEKLFGLAVVLFFGLLLLGTTFYSTILSVVQTWQTIYLDWQPPDNPGVSWLVDLLSTLIPPLVSVITFIILYRTIPRNKVSWRDVWLGGLLAGMIWEAARRLYTWYLANFASYSLIYGSVGAIIGFLLWAYLGAQILLLGAEFSAQHTTWRQAGRPVESRRPHEWMNEWSK
jgi:membrane protein